MNTKAYAIILGAVVIAGFAFIGIVFFTILY
jgi:hypothetical protein